MPKISIVVPVYNTSLYLKQCIESLINQDFSDYEIILVNDGSTDDSGSVCDFYSSKYSFITTIHKENGGPSDARNVGIERSTGEYILFVDSDDFIHPNSLSNLYKTIHEMPEVDVIFLEAMKFFPNGEIVPFGEGFMKENIYGKSQVEVLQHIASLNKFPGSACTKLVRSKLIKTKNLYFKKGQLSEDIDWTLRLLLAANSFSYCSSYIYYYRQNRHGSITNTISLAHVTSLLDILDYWTNKIATSSFNSDMRSHFTAFLSYEYVMVILLYGNLNQFDKKTIQKKVKKYSWLLSTSRNKKVIVVRIVYKILGLELTAKLLSYYRGVHNNGGGLNRIFRSLDRRTA